MKGRFFWYIFLIITVFYTVNFDLCVLSDAGQFTSIAIRPDFFVVAIQATSILAIFSSLFFERSYFKFVINEIPTKHLRQSLLVLPLFFYVASFYIIAQTHSGAEGTNKIERSQRSDAKLTRCLFFQQSCLIWKFSSLPAPGNTNTVNDSTLFSTL